MRLTLISKKSDNMHNLPVLTELSVQPTWDQGTEFFHRPVSASINSMRDSAGNVLPKRQLNLLQLPIFQLK